jgi:hypothetical protein
MDVEHGVRLPGKRCTSTRSARKAGTTYQRVQTITVAELLTGKRSEMPTGKRSEMPTVILPYIRAVPKPGSEAVSLF